MHDDSPFRPEGAIEHSRLGLRTRISCSMAYGLRLHARTEEPDLIGAFLDSAYQLKDVETTGKALGSTV